MIIPALLMLLSQTSAATAPIPSWGGLSAEYRYKPLEPGDVKESLLSADGAVNVRFTFAGTPGDTVDGLLVEPNGKGPFPVAILLHGLGGNKDSMPQMLGKALLTRGIAYAAIDAPGHGERATPDDQKALQAITASFLVSHGDLLQAALSQDADGHIEGFLARATIDGVLDNRHLIDFLDARKDIDYHHITLIGDSMGSIIGTILGSVDNRIQAMLLMVGGDPALPLIDKVSAQYCQKAIATSCSLYAPHYKNPVRMLSGSKDTIMPRAATDRLYSAFPDGKKSISWFNSDHFLLALANEEAVQWTADRDGLGK